LQLTECKHIAAVDCCGWQSHLRCKDLLNGLTQAPQQLWVKAQQAARPVAARAEPEDGPASSGAVLGAHDHDLAHQQPQHEDEQHYEVDDDSQGAADGGGADGADLATKFGGNAAFASVLQAALQRGGGSAELIAAPASASKEYEEP
jgi:hypothetical protein